MSDGLVTIARLTQAHEGHLLRMRLAAAGIEAFVIGDHARHTGMLEMGGQIRVQVRESDVDEALDVLSEDEPYGEGVDIPLEELEAEALAGVAPEDADDDAVWPGPAPAPQPIAPPEQAYSPPSATASPIPLDGSMRCPNCGVGNVHRRRLGPLLMVVGVLLLGVPLIVMRNTWICDICGHKWRPD